MSETKKLTLKERMALKKKDNKIQEFDPDN